MFPDCYSHQKKTRHIWKQWPFLLLWCGILLAKGRSGEPIGHWNFLEFRTLHLVQLHMKEPCGQKIRPMRAWKQVGTQVFLGVYFERKISPACWAQKFGPSSSWLLADHRVKKFISKMTSWSSCWWFTTHQKSIEIPFFRIPRTENHPWPTS